MPPNTGPAGSTHRAAAREPGASDGSTSPGGANAPDSDHLRTDHLRTNLRGRAISGGVITAASQVVRFGLYMVSTIVLARLLSKEDFGLVAMVATLTGFLRMFREGGLSTTTVQKEHITQAQVSNLFWINVSLGAATTLLGACFAPVLAWFYKNDALIPITIILSTTFLLSGSTVQHLALLNRQMRFKAIAVVDVGSMAIGLVVGVILAKMDWRYWSLVWSQVATSAGEVLLTWLASKWRPGLPSRNSGTRSMLGFGASLTFASFLRRVAGSADCLLVGRVYGEAALGLYTRGLALLMRPLDQFLSPFDSVFIPILSRIQDQPERYRRTFLEVYSAMALTSFPVAGLFLGLSEPLVLVLLSPKWADVIPIFASLTLTALVYPIAAASMWLLTTQGRSRDIMTSGLVFSLIAVGAFSFGLPYGPHGVALAFSLSWICVRLPYQYYLVGKSGPVGTRDLWNVLLRHLPSWIGVAAASYLTVHATHASAPLVQLVAGGCAGMLAAIAMLFILPWQRKELLGLIGIAKTFMRRKKNDAISTPHI